MNNIDFSEVGVNVNSIEELDDIVTLYTMLEVKFDLVFYRHYEEAKRSDFAQYFIQTSFSNLSVLADIEALSVSIIKYPIKYEMDRLDFAIAYQLIAANKTEQAIAYMNEHCKEYKQ